MAYRRPGVVVTQEFVGLVPALAAFALPSVTVGPAYQLVDDDALGYFEAVETLYPYASMVGGAIADTEALDPNEQFPITKKPITVTLKNAKVEIMAEQHTGSGSADVFVDNGYFNDGYSTPPDPTPMFGDVQVGDILTIVPSTDVPILNTRSDGESASANPNRLLAGSGNSLLFAAVKAGDKVEVTGGANTNEGIFTVEAKVNQNILLLSKNADDEDLNNGGGSATNISYSIYGDRGAANAGDYVVKSKTDDNTLVLSSPLADTPESPITYYIRRSVGSVVLDRVASISENGFVPSVDGITLPAVITNANDLPIVYGEVVASYRALRTDFAAEVKQFTDVNSLNAAFGLAQILPANPLAYGVSIMMQNTVTPVHGLGLDANAVVNEVVSYTQATDVLKRGQMYAIALLTQNPVVHTLYKNHVEQLSQPLKKQERIVIINSRLVDTMILQEESTTVVQPNGARTIVGMQIDGSGSYSVNPKKLVDATTGQFASVAAGDSLVIVSGTGVVPGTYVVASVTDANNLLTTTNFLSSGVPTDIQYYIYRNDGLAAGGASFYDRNASFLSGGIASGHYLSILAGPYTGRYRIASVLSEKELTLSPVIVSAVSLATGITYQVDRDLQKFEQAEAVRGYSQAFGSRRVVHIWPDVLEAPVGQAVEKLPGYYACCAIAGLTTGLPTQQGLTNLAVSGFLGFEHSSRYFTEEELDTIADGGTMILAQDGISQPLYVRHQLTTDRSAIKFQEYSVTKNVDFIAKFLRNTFSRYIGQYNIVDTTIDALKTTAAAAIKFLKDNTRVARFGGVIRSGSLTQLVESPDQIDTVIMRFSFSIPIPLNNIDITIVV